MSAKTQILTAFDDYYSMSRGIEEKEQMTEGIKASIKAFVAEVERRAESKMLKTGTLEGSHYAAMKELMKEIEK